MRNEQLHSKILGLVSLIGLMGLWGCSSDETAAPALTTVELISYVADYEDATKANGPATRAWTPPTGYLPYGEDDKVIGIAFTQDGKEPKTGNFFKSSGKWLANIDEIKSSGSYFLYGYIPHLSGMSMTITDRDGANANYSSGAKVTLQNVPAIMPNDLCVTIGAKQGTDKETVTGLRMGDFGYTANGASNYVFLLFDHLYAALRIDMKVYGEYNKLRTIVLKSLSMKTQTGETTSHEKTAIAIDLKATDDSNPEQSPIQSITYTPQGEVISEPMEFWSSTGETLTTEFSTHVGHFMPTGITKLILTSTYDVYDKKGNLLRQDCKATNTMLLSDLLTDQTTTRRGCRYTVRMTIHPTYLYVLSDPDLNNPTVSVE